MELLMASTAAPDRVAVGLQTTRSKTADDIALLRLPWPAPNAWTASQQMQFVNTLQAFGARPDVSAIIIQGARLFDEQTPLGAQGESFQRVIDAIANSPIPVIAAMGGRVSGAGLELALACAARVASPAARCARPDLTAGRLAFHGAVERLSRLVGPREAAEMIIFGAEWNAQVALKRGLVNIVAEKGLLGQAKALARSNRWAGSRPEALSWETTAADFAEVRKRIRRLNFGKAAPLAALKAMENAAELPLRRSMLETASISSALSRTREAQALSYGERGSAALAKWGSLSTREALAGRLRWPLLREAIHLLDEGANPGQIDRCLLAYGFTEAPFAESDRRGLNAVFTDSCDPVSRALPWLTYSPTLDLMADAKRLGGGAPGWYQYRGDGLTNRVFDGEVSRIVEASATSQRMKRRPLPDEMVSERCLLAAINTSLLELQDGDGLRADMVDAAWVGHLGFPAWKGGPLYQAGEMGLARTVEKLSSAYARRNTIGAPSQILVRTAARNGALR